MRKIFFVILASVVMTMGFMSNSCVKRSAWDAADTVVIGRALSSDSSCFRLANGSYCKMFVQADVAYPKKYRNSKNTKLLQSLFAHHALNMASSARFMETLKNYASVITNDNSDSVKQKPGTADIQHIYKMRMNVSTGYNQNGIISFCLKETITKDEMEPSQEQTFFNFDLATMGCINLDSLFLENSRDAITNLLRNKLIADNNASGEEDLHNLGYFNLDNLTVNNNFFISREGITWSYKPGAIAIMKVGEPQVFLSFNELEEFYNERSPLKRF